MRTFFEGISHIRLRDKRYKVLLVSKLGTANEPLDGDCAHPKTPGKTIRYQVSLKGESCLDVLTHEMLHACFWDVKEESIDQGSSDIAHALWRIGYRNDVDLLQPDLQWPSYVVIRCHRYKFEVAAGMPVGEVHKVSAASEKDKVIQVRVSLRGEKQLEGILLALLGAAYSDFDEEATKESAKDIARALWRMGYRRTTE